MCTSEKLVLTEKRLGNVIIYTYTVYVFGGVLQVLRKLSWL